MPSSTPETPEESVYDVAVIGGGLAGISAAIGLTQSGKRVILLESKRKLGGRAGSFVDTTTEKEIDYCQHVGMHCCTALRRLIESLGQTDSWRPQKQLYFVGEPRLKNPNQTRYLTTGNSWLPAPFHLVGLLWKWPKLNLFDQTTIAIGMWRLFRTPAPRLPTDQTAAEWLRNIGQHERAIQHFWQTIIVSALGESIETVGIKATRKVIVDGFAASRSATWLLIPKKPLSQLFGDEAQRRLTKLGVTVKTETRVTAIGTTDNAIQIESDSSRSDGQGKATALKANCVVLATQWHQTARLLKSLNQDSHLNPSESATAGKDRNSIDQIIQATERMRPAPITGIHTWWDKNWLTRPNAILVDRFCHWVFSQDALGDPPEEETQSSPTHSGKRHSDREHYLQIVISGSHDVRQLGADEVRRRLLNDLNEVCPESREASLLRFKIVTDPQAVYALTASTDEIRPNTEELMSDNIWLAGDWVQTGWPATMEGAIRSGFMAADSICNSPGDSKSTPEEHPRELLAKILIR